MENLHILTNKKKWYESSGGIIAMLILFFPVGLFLMWKYAKWKKLVKWVLTLIYAIIVLGLSNSSSSVNNKIKVTPTKKLPVALIKHTTFMPKKIKPKNTPVPTDPCNDIVGTSGWASCEDSLAPTEPPLKATVQISDQYLIVTNNSDVDWTNCYASIGSDTNPNDFYQQDPSSSSSIPAGGTFDFAWSNIVKPDGTRFNYASTEPDDIIIGCDYGKDSEGIWTNYQ